MDLTCKEILEATKGVLVSGNPDSVFHGVSTDSRIISAGELFVPLVGKHFDGHDFIEDSFSQGATGVISQRDGCYRHRGAVVIRVPDTLKALRDIAAFYRLKFGIPFIGITGSVGKTTTKDMIACVLGQKYKVLKTEGNFNNEIGLPLTVLKLDKSHEAAVIEMGMSAFGEISRLTSIVKPDIAVITNIGLSHVEKLGSRQNILKAKMEILEGFRKDGLVVLNGDDTLLYGLKNLLDFRMVFYGMDEGLDYQAYNVKTAGEHGTYFQITLDGTDWDVHIPSPGVHNIYNALAAIAVGIELNVPADRIVKGISEFHTSKMRMDIITHKGIKIINDAYNASPQSMEAAIEVLKDINNAARKIAVLGDMLELGNMTEKAHMDVGKLAFSKGINYIVTVGKNSKNIARGAIEAGASPDMVRWFEDNNRTVDFLKGFLQNGDIILIKGSRGMKLEEIVNKLLDEI